MQDIVPVLKLASNLLIGSGVGTIVTGIVKTNLPAKANLFQKITVPVGSFFLSGALASIAADHAETQIDKVAAAYKHGQTIAHEILKDADNK